MAKGKFKYRMQSVLDLAVRKEDEEKEKLAKVLQEEEQERQMMAQLKQQLADTLVTLKKKQQEKTLDISALRTFPQRIKFLENKIIAQELRLKEMAIKVMEQRTRLMHAAQNRQKYEKHKESSEAAWKAELEAKENAMIDELATLKYARVSPDSDI